MISDITSNYGVKKYVLDSLDDLENLRTTDKMGSTAYAIDPGIFLILNGDKEWVPYAPAGFAISDVEEKFEDYYLEQNDDGK